MQTNKSSWNGLMLILTIVLILLFGVMNLASSWTVTDNTVVGKKEKNHTLHHVLNIPLKYIWAGISKREPTGICIFKEIMDAPFFCQILRQTLLPFLQEKFPTPNSHIDACTILNMALKQLRGFTMKFA